MIARRFRVLMLAGAAAAFSLPSFAQQSRSSLPQSKNPNLPPLIQMLQSDPDALPEEKPPRASKPGAGTISCTGAFGKNSDHVKLAAALGERNVVFTDVDGPPGTTLKASVAFPTDPSRRLEVLWSDDAGRSDTSLIVIAGRSTWSGPKGLRLGLPLTKLESINRKPFRLTGFDENGASAIEWENGALDHLPGGCKVGIRLVLDPKTPEKAREEVSGPRELMSDQPAVRAVRAKIAEIILGY
jgi:hypothetical protein